MICAAEHLDKEIEVLHRTVRVVNDGLMEIEADQKHVPQLLENLGLTRSNVVKTPRVKLSAIKADAIENSPILQGEKATLFRSGTMRCAYLAQDRVDISEAVKCLARAMSKPRAGHMTHLKRVARYLKGVPRKAQQYPAQKPSDAYMEVHCGQCLGRRHCNASKYVRSDRETWTTLAKSQFNSAKRDWPEQCGK